MFLSVQLSYLQAKLMLTSLEAISAVQLEIALFIRLFTGLFTIYSIHCLVFII